MGFEKKSRPMARAYRSTAQTIANNTLTALSMDGQLYDTDGMFTPTDTKIYAKRFSGYYFINGACSFVANATGERLVGIKKNAAVYLAVHQCAPNPSDAVTVLNVSTVEYFAVNEYIELFVRQQSGGNLDTYPDIADTYLALAHLSGR